MLLVSSCSLRRRLSRNVKALHVGLHTLTVESVAGACESGGFFLRVSVLVMHGGDARPLQGINNLTDVWDTSKGECVVMMQSELEKMFDKVRSRA